MLDLTRNKDPESKEADCCLGLRRQILFLHQELTYFPLLLDKETRKELKKRKMYLMHIVIYTTKVKKEE